MLTSKCECEHESHFCYAHTPNNNPAHKYGIHYADHFIVAVKTPYGTFHVCKDCANDCYQDYPQVEKINRVIPRSEERQNWIDKYGDKEDI